jgi:hypothetical protein
MDPHFLSSQSASLLFFALLGAPNPGTTGTPGKSFTRQLDYPDDDEDNDGLLFMASPTQVELDDPFDPNNPFDPNKHLLTPSQGSPQMDPTYTNGLQNLDSYGLILTSKTLAMIDNKIEWNGKCSSFDEGHFEGNGASYLIHHHFLEKYELHGYKVLRFFPHVRLRPEELEKQNGPLYGSLKQICCKGAAMDLIWNYEQKRDGMLTWLDLFKQYNNMRSNNVMTIHYDAVLAWPFHHKYPGGLEQFVADYEEAYSELTGIGEHHPNLALRH